MADERVVAELVAQGAARFIQDFANSANAVSKLQTTLESTNRISTSQLKTSLDTISRDITQLSKDGVKDLDDVIRKFAELREAVTNAGQRIRTPQLRSMAQDLQGALGEVGAARNRAQIAPTRVGTLDPTIRLQQAQIQAVAEAQLKAQRAAEAHANTLRGRLEPAFNAVGTVLARVLGLQQQTTQTTNQITQATTQATTATNQNAAALINQSSAQQGANTQGITYLSTLSAIHAASFLATGRTFSLIGSFFTLGAAFSRMGPLAVVVGLAFGGLLGIFNALSTTIQLLQRVLLGVAQVALTVSGIVAAAVTAIGTASVKIAADVEQGLALIQAIEGASREQLGRLTGEAQRLALAYGISVKDIVDASSLFVRAGGDIEGAINGATEAVIKLQVASAGELKAADAARTIATGLAAFNLAGDQSIRIANNVAAAFQRSALTATEVNQAFQQAIPGSITFGIKIEDLTAIIVTLGATLRGTVAGTSFKQFLLDLVNPAAKGEKQLAALGVSVKDADGNIRPIIPIIGDLSAALEKLTPAGRAEAIAEIFESRAGLAGSILSRQSAESLQNLRAELEALTVTDIVDVLLLPLNAQLQRLQVTVGEFGRVFGGTLLQPIRTATVAAIDFFTKLIPLAELAGQSVSVILTGQGFGALQQKISEITDNDALQRFLIGIVNSFRNVRDVVVNQIVPAIIDFVSSLGLIANEEGRVADIDDAFKNLDRTIQNIGAAVAGAIKAFGILVTNIVHNEGKGKELRDTLDSLIRLIVTQMVVGLALMTAGLVISVKALDLIATTIRTHVLPHISSVAGAIAKLSDLSILAIQTFVAPWTALVRAVVTAKSLIEGTNLDTALENAAKAADSMQGILSAQLTGPSRAVNGIAEGIKAIADGAVAATTDVNKFLEDARGQAAATIKVYEDLTGELPNFLSNLLEEISRTQAQARKDADTGGVTPNIVDTKEIDRARERILEAGRDLGRRLDNLAEDTTTKITNIVDKALERIGDINQKLQINLAKLEHETKEKIDDLNQAVVQRRDDRSRLDVEKRQQERRLQVIERSLEKQQLFEERQLEQVRILRQRGLEDAQRAYDLQADAAERSYSRAQEAAEASFSAQQDAQQKALELTQSAEEKALQRQLDLESRTRDEGQQRSEAKTPEDRKRVEEQIARARQDRAFEARQQGQLDALATRHEAQRTQLAARQEQQQLAFKTQQEDAALAERLKRDARALVFRRELENQERNVRLREEDSALVRRINNETVLDTIKRTQAKAFQNFQDGLENEATKRRIEEFKADELKRKGDLIQGADTQRGEVLDGVTQQLSEVNQAVEREIRNALDRLKDIEDSLTPDVAAAVRGALLGVQQAALQRSKALIEGTQVQTQQAHAVVGAQLEVTQPTQVQSLIATTMQVATLNLPGGFVNGIAQGMFFALAEADRRGFFNSDIPSLQGLIDELRSPSPLPTRR